MGAPIGGRCGSVQVGVGGEAHIVAGAIRGQAQG